MYNKFVSAIHEVQQKAGFKNLLLEKKLLALADVLEKKEAQLNEVQISPDQLHVIICIISRDFIFSKIFRIVKRFLFGSILSELPYQLFVVAFPIVRCVTCDLIFAGIIGQ